MKYPINATYPFGFDLSIDNGARETSTDEISLLLYGRLTIGIVHTIFPWPARAIAACHYCRSAVHMLWQPVQEIINDR